MVTLTNKCGNTILVFSEKDMKKRLMIHDIYSKKTGVENEFCIKLLFHGRYAGRIL